VSGTLVLRESFALDDRTFAVIAEPWYDVEAGDWKGRLLYIPLDHSFPRSLSTGPIRRSRRRDELVRRLGEASDQELARALRSILGPLARARRER
jgi:hypothetical protein